MLGTGDTEMKNKRHILFPQASHGGKYVHEYIITNCD